ncbi:hypothetical protein NEOLEDRAFT_1182347 [Neolentinus lepideus HHB14362 ss-1]|uniref:Uncharacterized protein n=1 Tax=Neolentinus lepideus HHB14362 ss-1 TaxID=1314782 RepID=A0A165P702_9AGAM|nr:hypothetical protein NEOLEDRAFT_1182347 [Neolentinus lepideus HHB14362 ss-1]
MRADVVPALPEKYLQPECPRAFVSDPSSPEWFRARFRQEASVASDPSPPSPPPAQIDLTSTVDGEDSGDDIGALIKRLPKQRIISLSRLQDISDLVRSSVVVTKHEEVYIHGPNDSDVSQTISRLLEHSCHRGPKPPLSLPGSVSCLNPPFPLRAFLDHSRMIHVGPGVGEGPEWTPLHHALEMFISNDMFWGVIGQWCVLHIEPYDLLAAALVVFNNLEPTVISPFWMSLVIAGEKGVIVDLVIIQTLEPDVAGRI